MIMLFKSPTMEWHKLILGQSGPMIRLAMAVSVKDHVPIAICI